MNPEDPVYATFFVKGWYLRKPIEGESRTCTSHEFSLFIDLDPEGISSISLMSAIRNKLMSYDKDYAKLKLIDDIRRM